MNSHQPIFLFRSSFLVEILDLSNNKFSGSIPDQFSNLAKLDTFDLSSNGFIGALPISLFDVPTIRLIYLTDNQLSSSIPSNFGSPELLRDLYLDANELVGTVPSISTGQLSNLNEFLLQNNVLTGTMPSSICALREPAVGTLEDLWADCELVNGVVELECNCCTQCRFP